MLDTLTARYLSRRFPEASPMEFYRDLFPEGELERKGEYVDGMYCGIAVRVVGEDKAKRYSVTDDLDVIRDLAECDDFCIMSPVSYAGKAQRQENARFLYALTLDLDGLLERKGEPIGLENLFHQMTLDNAFAVPVPTYIAASGTGVHLYYMLERPVPLFRNVIKQLSALRRELVKLIWNSYVTRFHESRQFESVTQGFRMVGTVTKNGVDRVRAFRTGAKVTIEYLNRFCYDEASRVTSFSYKSKLTLDQAKERYPEWYERRIVAGERPGTWTVKRDLYDWWKRKMLEPDGASDGHRYFCVMALAIYARKCGIEFDELLSDAMGMIAELDRRGTRADNPFTEDHVVKALEAYNASYQTFPRATIEELTAIPIPPNKRNGRKQAVHLMGARAIQEINDRVNGTDWRTGNGRKPKRDAIRAYAYEHPDASQREMAAALGVSKTTVNKWLKPGWREEYEASICERPMPKPGELQFGPDGARVELYSIFDEPVTTDKTAGKSGIIDR